MKWCGHVVRREAEYVGKRVMVMEVPGKRRRGRPKWRWLDNTKKDLSERELSREETQEKYRPHINVGKNAEDEDSVYVHHCLWFSFSVLLHHSEPVIKPNEIAVW